MYGSGRSVLVNENRPLKLFWNLFCTYCLFLWITWTFARITRFNLDPLPCTVSPTVRRRGLVTETVPCPFPSSTNSRAIGPLRPCAPASIAGLFFCKFKEFKSVTTHFCGSLTTLVDYAQIELFISCACKICDPLEWSTSEPQFILQFSRYF